MTKAQYDQVKRDAYHLALDIGLNPAARAMGINPDRVRKWAQRDKWNIGLLRPPGHNNAPLSQGVTNAIEVKRKLLGLHSDRTRLGFAQAGTVVAEGLAEKTYGQLIAPATAIAAEQWSRVGDRTHGWSAERAKGTSVQVAVVNLPSAEQDNEREAIHDKLDAIAKRLRERST